MIEWLARQAREHPARTVRLGFMPAIIVVAINTYRSMLVSVWMGLLMIPLLMGVIVLVIVMGKVVQLNRDLDRRD